MPGDLTINFVVVLSAKSPGALQGEMIRIAREARHLTQQDLAELMHVSRSTISKWEASGLCPEIYLLESILNVRLSQEISE